MSRQDREVLRAKARRRGDIIRGAAVFAIFAATGTLVGVSADNAWGVGFALMYVMFGILAAVYEVRGL